MGSNEVHKSAKQESCNGLIKRNFYIKLQEFRNLENLKEPQEIKKSKKKSPLKLCNYKIENLDHDINREKIEFQRLDW